MKKVNQTYIAFGDAENGIRDYAANDIPRIKINNPLLDIVFRRKYPSENRSCILGEASNFSSEILLGLSDVRSTPIPTISISNFCLCSRPLYGQLASEHIVRNVICTRAKCLPVGLRDITPLNAYA